MKCRKNHPKNAIYRIVSIAEGQTVKETDFVGSKNSCNIVARLYSEAMSRDGYNIVYDVVLSSPRDTDIIL